MDSSPLSENTTSPRKAREKGQGISASPHQDSNVECASNSQVDVANKVPVIGPQETTSAQVTNSQGDQKGEGPDIQDSAENDNTDPQDIAKIRELCPHFRVLIIGRANSGKTTILGKMCDTDEAPMVHDENGKERLASELQGASIMRSAHDIKLQITYRSKPEFIFHDSEGFESGREDELEKVIKFIEEMSSESELRNRLHVIWYCVPTGTNRVASKAELSFFERSRGGVPVILLFTKWDGQVSKAFSELRNEEVPRPQARKDAPRRAEEILKKEYIPVFDETTYPPTSYTVLENMHKPDTKCSELAEKTAEAMTDGVLKKLFVSVQTQNILLCVKSAIDEIVQEDFRRWGPDQVVGSVISWFPHAYWTLFDHNKFKDETFEYSQARKEEWGDDVTNPHNHYLLFKYRREATKLLQDIVSNSQQSFPSGLLQGISIAISCAIVAKHSFEINKQHKSVQDAITTTAVRYLESSQSQAVKTAIQSELKEYETSNRLPEGQRKAAAEKALKICLDNMLG